MNIIHIKAPNDNNGNPRRLYLVMQDNKVLYAINEGYRGIGALDDIGISERPSLDINVSAKEYKDLLKAFEK